MKRVVLMAVAVAIVALAPSAALGANDSTAPRPLMAGHASTEPDTVSPVVETWSIWDQFFPVLWIDAALGVSDDTSDTYTARVKVKFHGREVELIQNEFDGYCSDYGTDTIYLERWLKKFKRGKYTAYVSAWDEAGNKSKAKRVDFWVR